MHNRSYILGNHSRLIFGHSGPYYGHILVYSYTCKSQLVIDEFYEQLSILNMFLTKIYQDMTCIYIRLFLLIN